MQLLLKAIFFSTFLIIIIVNTPNVFGQSESGQVQLTPVTDTYQQNIEDIRESRFGLNNLAYLLGMGDCTKDDKDKIICEPVDARQAILRLIQIALGFTSLIAFAFVAYGGFLWATAGGSEERVGKGKKILTWAAVGTIVIVTAWGIVTLIMSLISQVV